MKGVVMPHRATGHFASSGTSPQARRGRAPADFPEHALERRFPIFGG